MKPATNLTAEKMKSVKASFEKAPFGEKRYMARKHYYAAETAYAAKNVSKTHEELDAAKQALA